ncbi:MAG: hypothetical protein JNK05_38325 [Myxococcales bacterium]|nr:hypothetical protein [Myxococcales bacterium]
MFDQFVPREGVGRSRRACAHAAANPAGYWAWFFGVGVERGWVCAACAAAYPTEPAWVDVTPEWAHEARGEGSPSGTVGAPQVLVRDTGASFAHERVSISWARSIVDLVSFGTSRDEWAILLRDGTLIVTSLRATQGERRWPSVALGFEVTDQCAIHSSKSGRYIAVVEASASRGAVFDTERGAVVLALDRKSYHAENSRFPFAFVDAAAVRSRLGHSDATTRAHPIAEDADTFVIAASNWNRLDLYDPATGRVLSERSLATSDTASGARDATRALDYFHGALSVSPRSRWVLDSGWHWHPWGADNVWSIDAWFENPYESEDGASRASLVQRAYFWDGPAAWIDEDTVVVWGYGDDDETLIPAALICSVYERALLRWFAGPTIRQPAAYPPRNLKDTLVFDRWLFSVSESDGTCVWDVRTGERIARDPALAPWRYHPGAREWATVNEDHVVLSRFVERSDEASGLK